MEAIRCPFKIVGGTLLRQLDGEPSLTKRLRRVWGLKSLLALHVRTMGNDCPDHKDRVVGYRLAPRPCRVAAQRLIDEFDLGPIRFLESEMEFLEGNVCFSDTNPLVRVAVMAIRDGYIAVVKIPDLVAVIDDPDGVDSEEFLSMILSSIEGQDGDYEALFRAWRVAL